MKVNALKELDTMTSNRKETRRKRGACVTSVHLQLSWDKTKNQLSKSMKIIIHSWRNFILLYFEVTLCKKSRSAANSHLKNARQVLTWRVRKFWAMQDSHSLFSFFGRGQGLHVGMKLVKAALCLSRRPHNSLIYSLLPPTAANSNPSCSVCTENYIFPEVINIMFFFVKLNENFLLSQELFPLETLLHSYFILSYANHNPELARFRWHKMSTLCTIVRTRLNQNIHPLGDWKIGVLVLHLSISRYCNPRYVNNPQEENAHLNHNSRDENRGMALRYLKNHITLLSWAMWLKCNKALQCLQLPAENM